MGAPANFAAGHHVMQLYESEDSLALSVAAFFARGLAGGDPVVMISSPQKFDLVRRHLSLQDHVLKELQFVDAEAALAQAWETDGPNLTRLQRAFDGLLAEIRRQRQHATIWIYGDAVDLLCKAHKQEAAVNLEEFGNSLCSRYQPIAMLCGYAIENFDDYETADRLRDVCRRHTHIIPAYGFTDRDCGRAALQPVAMLQ